MIGLMLNFKLSIDVTYPCYFWSPFNVDNWKGNGQNVEIREKWNEKKEQEVRKKLKCNRAQPKTEWRLPWTWSSLHCAFWWGNSTNLWINIHLIFHVSDVLSMYYTKNPTGWLSEPFRFITLPVEVSHWRHPSPQILTQTDPHTHTHTTQWHIISAFLIPKGPRDLHF